MANHAELKVFAESNRNWSPIQIETSQKTSASGVGETCNQVFVLEKYNDIFVCTFCFASPYLSPLGYKTRSWKTSGQILRSDVIETASLRSWIFPSFCLSVGALIFCQGKDPLRILSLETKFHFAFLPFSRMKVKTQTEIKDIIGKTFKVIFSIMGITRMSAAGGVSDLI